MVKMLRVSEALPLGYELRPVLGGAARRRRGLGGGGGGGGGPSNGPTLLVPLIFRGEAKYII